MRHAYLKQVVRNTPELMCIGCKDTKPSSEFYEKETPAGAQSHDSYCKSCRSAKNKKTRSQGPVKIKRVHGLGDGHKISAQGKLLVASQVANVYWRCDGALIHGHCRTPLEFVAVGSRDEPEYRFLCPACREMVYLTLGAIERAPKVEVKRMISRTG